MRFLLIFGLCFAAFGFDWPEYIDSTGLVYLSNDKGSWDSLCTLADTPSLLLADTLAVRRVVTYSDGQSDTSYTTHLRRVVDELKNSHGILAAIYRFFNPFSLTPDSVKVYIRPDSYDTTQVIEERIER